MKKILGLILFVGLVQVLGLSAKSNQFTIKNEDDQAVYVGVVAGKGISAGASLQVNSLDPGNIHTKTVYKLPVYVGIWENFVQEADIKSATSGNGLVFNPLPTKLYRMAKPVNVFWKKGRLKPSGILGKFKRGKVEEITTIPSR